MTVQHIIELCNDLEEMIIELRDIRDITPRTPIFHIDIDPAYLGLADEIDTLSSLDFPPDKRAKFVKLRKSIQRRKLKSESQAKGHVLITRGANEEIKELKAVLESYGEFGSRENSVNFSFIHDSALRKIIVRDYHEVKFKLFPSGAWKSTVIMAGSILEAILTDALMRDPVKANAAACAPCNRIKKPSKKLPDGEWKLFDLIQVAIELNKIPERHSKTIDQSLRFYRNFVHPRREIKEQHECGESQAYLAIGGLGAVLEYLSDTE